MFIDVHDGPLPKRGDIVQSNVGKPRERTWMILRTHRVNRTIRKAGDLIPRFTVWMARWWELEPDFRMRLFRSAERNGGQNVLFFFRYAAKKKTKPIRFV